MLRSEASAFLHGCSLIIHAGDIGGRGDPDGGKDILDALNRLAPVIAVRGNNDVAPWARALQETELVRVGQVLILVTHDVAQATPDVAQATPDVAQATPDVASFGTESPSRVSVVVSGHSHQPRVEDRNGVLFVNPGSAGPRRFKLPIAVGELWIDGTSVTPRIVDLEELANGVYRN